MDKRYKTMYKTLKALKRQFCIEKIILGFYSVNILFMTVVFIVTTTEEMKNEDFNQIQITIVKVTLIYYSILFVIDFCNLVYFMVMGCNILRLT